ncbi:MAG: hypothetical protein F6J86_33470 [Symploca sp. SIO1B1]|nr:hypothetical protein [Symploca sp. SIO1B1]
MKRAKGLMATLMLAFLVPFGIFVKKASGAYSPKVACDVVRQGSPCAKKLYEGEAYNINIGREVRYIEWKVYRKDQGCNYPVNVVFSMYGDDSELPEIWLKPGESYGKIWEVGVVPTYYVSNNATGCIDSIEVEVEIKAL